MTVNKREGRWSPEEIGELRRLAAQGLRPSVIADQLGRPVGGIRGKAMAINLSLVGERSRQGVTLRCFVDAEFAQNVRRGTPMTYRPDDAESR